MSEIREINVTLESGIEQSAGHVMAGFIEAVDEAFLDNVVEFVGVHGENPEAAPANLTFKTDADPDAMKLETEFMLETNFRNVSASITPTDDEVTEILQEIENEITECVN